MENVKQSWELRNNKNRNSSYEPAELGHMEKLHEVVTELISEYREKHGEPPAGMMALYEYMHAQNIENTMRVKVKQAMFRET